MSHIDEEKVAHLARLARLKLTPAACSAIQHDLNKMMGLLDEINALETEGTQALAHPFASAMRLRRDEVTQTGAHQTRLRALAPEFEDHLYWVPQVIE